MVLHRACQEEGIAKGVDEGEVHWVDHGMETGLAVGRRTSIICVMIRVCFRRVGIVLYWGKT